MPNGRPGDHPLTDLFRHGLEVYGPEADELLRKISALSDDGEFREWWDREISMERDPEAILRKARSRLEALRAGGRQASKK